MLLYYFIFFLLIMYSLVFNYYTNEKLEKSIFIFISIFFWFLSAFRWETGVDWYTYYVMISKLPFSQVDLSFGSFEPGNVLLIKLYKLLYDKFIVFQIFVSTIILFFNYIVFYRFSKYSAILFLLYYCYFIGGMFNIPRQGIATALSMYSIIFLIDKKLIFFLLTNFIAFQFHETAIVFIPAYPIYHYLKFNIWLILTFLLFSFGIYITESSQMIFGLFLDFSADSKDLEIVNNGSLLGHAAGYVLNDEIKESLDGVGKGTTYYFNLFKRLVFIPLYLVMVKDDIVCGMKMKQALLLFIVGNVIYFLLCGGTVTTFSRLSVYYYVFEFFIIAYLLIKHKRNYFFVFLMYSFFIFKFVDIISKCAWIDPYYSYFEYTNLDEFKRFK